MGLGVLIPVIVPLITELLKLLAAKIDKQPPRVAYPATTPLTGMALSPLAGVDPLTGALLGGLGSWVYEVVKSLKKAKKH